jgi:hypothetical protein
MKRRDGSLRSFQQHACQLAWQGAAAIAPGRAALSCHSRRKWL